jgi:hypothetical protein
MRCKICSAEMEWEDCGACDEGFYDGYDEDPLWHDPGDLVPCPQCSGAGGWWVCSNLDAHFHNAPANTVLQPIG